MNYDSSTPIYLQVIDSIKKQIVTGRLPPGEKLPSTRELALEYGVNPNTAARIYREMEAQQLCFTKRGLGTFVTESEEMAIMLKKEMAQSVISRFFEEMKELGYNKQDMINAINEKE